MKPRRFIVAVESARGSDTSGVAKRPEHVVGFVPAVVSSRRPWGGRGRGRREEGDQAAWATGLVHSLPCMKLSSGVWTMWLV